MTSTRTPISPKVLAIRRLCPSAGKRRMVSDPSTPMIIAASAASNSPDLGKAPDRPGKLIPDRCKIHARNVVRFPLHCEISGQGAPRGTVQSARISEKRPCESSQRRFGVQPPASSSVCWLRWRELVAVLRVDGLAPRPCAKSRPETSNSISVRALRDAFRSARRCRSSGRDGAACRPGIVPASSRLIRRARLRLNSAVTPAASS